MTHAHSQTISGGRMRLVRATCVLLALLVCLILIPASTARADVAKKHRSAYKSKLTYYRNQMDIESDTFYTTWKQAVESMSNLISTALADTEHPENVPILEQSALDQRSLLQTATKTTRDKMYANIAAFRAKAVRWFKTKADRRRFKSKLATMRGGFVQIYAADEDLMDAFSALGMDADTAGASNEVMSGDMTRTTAEDLFAKGWRQLRALQ